MLELNNKDIPNKFSIHLDRFSISILKIKNNSNFYIKYENFLKNCIENITIFKN